jgi:hypothetical protein
MHPYSIELSQDTNKWIRIVGKSTSIIQRRRKREERGRRLFLEPSKTSKREGVGKPSRVPPKMLMHSMRIGVQI